MTSFGTAVVASVAPVAPVAPSGLETPAPRHHYLQAGHAKKLEPIIRSLDLYDNDPKAWQTLRERVEQMTAGWDELIRSLPDQSDARMLLTTQRDLCFEALRVQSDLFHKHRQTCVQALKLQRG